MGKRSKGRLEYGELRDMGLLPSEARAVQRIPNWRTIEWVQDMLREPAQKWNEARRRGTNRDRFDQGRVDSYVARGWLKPSVTIPAIDPYAWLRFHCDQYSADHPEYVSPWQTRGRSLRKEYQAVRNSMEYRATPEMRLEGAY